MADTTKNTHDLISVIVPVYNVQGHIAACLESLARQTDPSFEVIVVDDGSTDESLSRAQMAVGNDPRFRWITQGNEGLSGARNRGLDDARGAFVAFVDSDDKVAPDFLSVLRDALDSQPDCDWAACGIRNCFSDGSFSVHSAIFDIPDPKGAPGQQFFRFQSALDVIRHYPSAWNKLYRRSFIGDLRFPQGTWFEDHAFFLRLALRSHGLAHVDAPLYEQTRGRIGQITETDSDRIFDQLDVLDDVIPLLENGPLPDGRAAATKLTCRLLSERSRIIRQPQRRTAFIGKAVDVLNRHHMRYAPDPDQDTLASFGLELSGTCPLSVILLWDGRDAAGLSATLRNLCAQHGTGFEVLVPCQTSTQVNTARTLIDDLLSDWGPEKAQVFKANLSNNDRDKAGLSRAKGQFVMWVNAGDTFTASALQDRVEALLTLDAQAGFSARRHVGPEDQIGISDAGFETDFIPDHASAPTVFVATPRQALAADLSVSGSVFDRSFLESADLWPRGAHAQSAWSVPLGALMIADRSAYIPAIDVAIKDHFAHTAPQTLSRLTKDHKALCSGLPSAAATQLPKGWERRLWARMLRRWLMDGPQRGRLSMALALAGAVWTTWRRGMSRTDVFWRAGFDAQIGAKFALLFNPSGLVRLLRGAERARLATPRDPNLHAAVINPRHRNSREKCFVFESDAAAGETPHARFAVTFDSFEWANLSFYTHDGTCVPFHLSVRRNQNIIGYNDTRPDGRWRQERLTPFEIPKSGAEVSVALYPKAKQIVARVWIDDNLALEIPRRTLRQRTGLAHLDRISHVLLDPGLKPLDLCPNRGTPAPDGLYMDSRLTIRSSEPLQDGDVAMLDGHDVTLKCLPLPPTPSLDAGDGATQILLPSRVWSNQPADEPLTIRVQSPTGSDRALAVSRADLASRINALLNTGVTVAEAQLVLHMIELVSFAGLTDALDRSAQADLARLASAFDVSDMVPDLVPPQRYQRDPVGAETDALASYINRLPEDGPLLSFAPPDCQNGRHLTVSLVEWAVDQGRIADLYAEAKDAGTLPDANLPQSDLWTLTASLPLLWLDSREDDLFAALDVIKSIEKGWRVTPAMAWVLDAARTNRPAADGTTYPPAIRWSVIKRLLDWLHQDAQNYWGRLGCAQMRKAAADLLTDQDRLPSDLAQTAIWKIVTAYAFDRPFWQHLSKTPEVALPPFAVTARDAFDQLGSADPATRAIALDRLQHLGACDIARARTEYLGPAGVVPSAASPTPTDFLPLRASAPDRVGEAALRDMANPLTLGSNPALAPLVRSTIERLIPEQDPVPYLALQQRAHAQMNTLLSDAPPQASAVDEVLTTLTPLAQTDARCLGLGLGMSLLATLADAAQQEQIASWLCARLNSDDAVTFPAVRMGLTRLTNTKETAATRAVLDHVAGLQSGTAYPLPTLPDAPVSRAGGALPEPDPLNDVIVTVFSCHPFLDNRIPALRDGWLSDLKAMGIPYVIIVGNGDGRLDGDVLHVDAPDDYEGLPAKTLATLDWVRRNTTYSHLFKIDDDCFVDAPALFGSLSWRGVDYMGRRLTRVPGQMDRTWHQEKASTDRGRLELDKSPEPSTYADGGSGYVVSRDAMEAVHRATQRPEGRALIDASFMEDKLLGDLLALEGIALSTPGYLTSVRRRTFSNATPVAYWNAGFYPSLASPTQQVHMDTHLHQDDVRSLRDQAVLKPSKIWPSFQPPRLGYQSNALELISPVDRVERAVEADVAVVAVMRNEWFMLQPFLDHYRRLGVTSFLIADNASDDGTREFLLDQDDVALFSVDTDYSASHYGVAWQQALLHSFRKGKWSLVADADELIVWQTAQTQTLPDLLASPAFDGADAARVYMLDMYPQGPLEHADFKGASPFNQAGFADRVPFLKNPLTRGPYSDQTLYTSALRHRLIPGTRPDLFAAQKIALLKYEPWMRLSAGLHFVTHLNRAPQDLFFGHFKYNADFFSKAQAEVARKQHFNNAEEYQKYLALAAEGQAQIYDADLSLPWHQVPFVRQRLI